MAKKKTKQTIEKRYLLLSGDTYDLCGWEDWIGGYPTLQEAINKVYDLIHKNNRLDAYIEIFDLVYERVVWNADQTDDPIIKRFREIQAAMKTVPESKRKPLIKNCELKEIERIKKARVY